MNYEIIGSVAGFMTTISLVPQVIQVVKTKSTKDISTAMFLMFITGLSCWILYGLHLHSVPMVISNVVTLVLAFIILAYKLKYK